MNILTPKKIISIILSFIGGILISYYVSFFLMDVYFLDDKSYFDFFGLFAINSPMFSGHIFAIAGFLLIFIGSIIIKKKEPLLFKKVMSLIFDGSILVIWLFLIYAITKKEPSKEIDLFMKYEFDPYKYKIIGWGLFILIYYFGGEKSGGTFGKRRFGLTSIGNDKKKLSLQSSILKTVLYAFPILGISLIILFTKLYPYAQLNPTILINDTISFKFLQWASFLIYLLTFISIFSTNKSKSLAEILSKTEVIKIESVTSSDTKQV